MRITNFGLAATMLVSAVLLGGGNANFPVQRMLVELVSVAVLATLAWRGWRGPTDRWTVALMLFVGALFLVGIAQIIPLPASLWRTLPSRALPAEIADAIGAGKNAMPLSLTPDATIRALLFLLPASATLVATLACDRRERRRLLNWTVVLALFSAFLGMFQVASGPSGPYLYAVANQDPAVGVFSNHNHQADLLLIAMLLAATMSISQRVSNITQRLIISGVLVFLTITVIATMSRAGVVLMLPTLAISIALLLPKAILRDRRAWAAGAAGVIILAGLAALLSHNAMVIRTLDRFDTDTDPRFMFWPSVVQAAKDYFPMGSGLGSFVPVFKAVEPLEIVNRAYVVHAHNDYLELLIETGVTGLALIVLFAVLLATGLIRALRDPALRDRRRQITATASAIGILLIHSFGDYPLRTIALTSIFAMLMATLAATPAARRR
jgi:O-antigen ligase